MATGKRAGWLQKLAASAMDLTCPECGTVASAADVRPTEGTVTCPSCGHLWLPHPPPEEDPVARALSEWTPNSPPVPQPPKSAVRFSEGPQSVSFERRTGAIGLGIFLTFWLAIWSVGCVFLVANVLCTPSLGNVTFALPFCLAWLGATAGWVWAFFGRERLTVGPEGVRHTLTALVRVRDQVVPCAEISEVASYTKTTSSDSGTSTTHGIELRTTGRAIRFGGGLSVEERLWLADTLRRRLQGLATLVQPAAPAHTAERPAPAEEGPAPLCEVLQAAMPPLTPPLETSIRFARTPDGVSLSRGMWRRGSLGGLIGLTVFNAVWNGGMVVGVRGQLEHFDLFGAIFMIPFLLIGLVVLLLWLLALTSPFGRETWTLRRGELTRCARLLGVGVPRRVSLSQVARVELRSQWGNAASAGRAARPDTAGRSFSITLVAADGRDLARLGELAEPEARWVGDQVLQYR